MILAKPLEIIKQNFVGVNSYVERKFSKKQQFSCVYQWRAYIFLKHFQKKNITLLIFFKKQNF